MSRFKGEVKKSTGRGKKLGFPTANIEVPDDADEGIYLSWVVVQKQKLPSIFFVGRAITFGETEKKGEVYILDFDNDLYGETIEVEVIKKLRDNQVFDSPEELVSQMGEDKKKAKQYFASLKK